MSPTSVLIVGGGLAGVRTAQALRALGHAGELRILAGERQLPYDRPPLSKELLSDAAQEPDVRLLPAAEYERLGIELTLGARATGIDLARRTVALADGSTVGFEQLVVATGARPRRLPALARVRRTLTLRTLEDALALRAALLPGRDLIVVGGGFVGLEVAAAAVQRGCGATVVEACGQPLAAALGDALGAVLAGWHRSHGVQLLCGRTVRSAEERGGAARIVLDDGTRLDADALLCAVGVEPEIDWLAGTPLWSQHGVPCDEYGETAVAGVHAVGDAAAPRSGRRALATGHWTPASDLARRVAGAIAGAEREQRPLDDYLWSDQFGARLQLAGSIEAAGELRIEEGAIEDWSFLARCHVGEAVSGVFAMNRQRDFVRARLALQSAAA